MEVNKVKQIITYVDGTVHCDAFMNFGNGAHVRVTLKEFEHVRLYDHNRGRRKRFWKNYARKQMMVAGGAL